MASRSTSCRRGAAPPREPGFTYVWLLVVMAVTAVGLAAIGEVASTAAKRDKEAELLFVGDQFARAIAEYAASSSGTPQYPQRLQELLADKRFPNVRRYLRRVYPDPLTGRTDWALVRGPGGGIVAVHSQSPERPLKVANFPKSYESFAAAASYREWVFGFGPAGGAGAKAAKPPVQGVPIVPTVPGAIAAPPAADAPPPSPRERRVGLVPRDPSLCTAARASDLRDCDRAGVGGAARDECTQRAAQRYRACLAGGNVE